MINRKRPTSAVTLRRRDVLKTGAIGALTFNLAGCDALMTAREAREAGAVLNTFSSSEVATLDRLGDVLLPGAAAAGFTHFIDNQVSASPDKVLLTLRYMDWPTPYSEFYKSGAAALDAVSTQDFGAPFADLPESDANALIRSISGGNPDGWNAPPAPLFYFVTRSDAVDVVYGTVEGFEKLSLPYIPHILPEAKW